MKNKITTIGSGAMGTAISKIAYDSQNRDITIYGIDENELKDLEKGQNLKYFPKESKIPKFKTSNNLKEAIKGSNIIILAVPSKFMDKVFEQVLENLSSKVIIINVSKGFYPNTNKSLHEGIKNESKNNKFIKGVVSLMGPSHAEEIIKEMPTIIAAIDDDDKLLKKIQKIFYSPYFKTYRQTDVKGAEVGASYKNILAIVSGMAAGMGYGINTIAAILSRGMSEMMTFNDFFGGKEKTIMGLTGLGDLIVTATSDLSRNFSFGKEFILNKDNALKSNKTIEGLTALKQIYKISIEQKLYLPIVIFLFKVIFENENPKMVLKKFWNQDFKKE